MQRIHLILLGITLLLSFSCKKEIYKTLGKADIIGYADTREDIYYHSQEVEASGVLVTLIAGSDSYTTTTNEDGRFQFKDIDYGDYRLKCEKGGYNCSYITLTHTGNAPTIASSIATPVNVYEFPHYEILYSSPQSINIYSSSSYNWTTLNIGFKFENESALSGNVKVQVYSFISHSPEVDSANYEDYSSSSFYLSDINQPAQFDIYIPTNNLESGEKLYIRLYPANVNDGNSGFSSYTDPTTFKGISAKLGKPFKSLIKVTYN